MDVIYYSIWKTSILILPRKYIVGRGRNTRIWTHSLKGGVLTNEAYDSHRVVEELKSWDRAI